MSDVFCLMGPTAAGKTALACELTQRFPMEIISVDSAMIYRGMDIGTAKPSLAEQLQAPHHLIDMLDPPESFSAAEFCQHAQTLIQAIKERNKIPLLTGGTMMYFNALQQGLSALPKADAALRASLLQQAEERGWLALHAELKRLDPASGARIHPHDTQRIQRALEVFYLTGTPLSTFLANKNDSLHCVNLILFPEDRAWLHQRIAQRFHHMLQAGFMAEAEQIINHWQLTPAHPALRCVGYRQAFNYLSGEDNYAAFVEKGIAATRQLAKRQLTWLRSWSQGRFFACDKANVVRDIVANIAEMLDNKRQHDYQEKSDA